MRAKFFLLKTPTEIITTIRPDPTGLSKLRARPLRRTRGSARRGGRLYAVELVKNFTWGSNLWCEFLINN